MSNSFGKIFTFTSFGESHGKAIGGIVDGCPSGIELDEDFIQNELKRRRPGQSAISTDRQEEDRVEFLSGIFEGKTTGTPIAFTIANKDQHSSDYKHLKDVYRPSHADYTYEKKYGLRDHRGGGRSSARETAARVVAGAIAKLALRRLGIEITAYTSRVGHIAMTKSYDEIVTADIEANIVRCPEAAVAEKMIEYIKELKEEGDSIGGIVSCSIKGLPVGWGNPIFDKISARLAQANMSINAAHGFDYGRGFEGVNLKGSEMNDAFVFRNNKVETITNNSGGIQGGISNGESIYFRVLFKPVATIAKKQQTLDKENKEVELKARGRHDPCVLPRAVPVVEAMTAIALMDFMLMDKEG